MMIPDDQHSVEPDDGGIGELLAFLAIIATVTAFLWVTR